MLSCDAVSHLMRAVPERSDRGCRGTYLTLGTERSAFPIGPPLAATSTPTPESQVVAVLEALAGDGETDPSVPVAAARQSTGSTTLRPSTTDLWSGA